MTANEYATLIYYWHAARGSKDEAEREPQKRLREMVGCLAATERTVAQDFTDAGVLSALAAVHPEEMAAARLDHPDLFKRLESIKRLSAPGRNEWCYFHFGEWLITHENRCVDTLLDRVADGGPGGQFAKDCLEKWGQSCVPFKYAIERAVKARHEAMVIKVMQ